MLSLMDENKRSRIDSLKSELEKVIEGLKAEYNELAPTDDFILLNTAIYYLDRATRNIIVNKSSIS